MSTEEERAARQIVNAARQRRGEYRLFEIALVLIALGTFLFAILFTGVGFDTRQVSVWVSAGALALAAFYNLYGNVILQPSINRAQEALNRLVGDK